MTVNVVVGAQWGDEGKGKVVDMLTEHADVVARYGGGANAGHTLVVNGRKTVIRLVPSGILQDKPLCVLGSGMVIDPAVLRTELETLASYGVDTSAKRVLVSEHAHVVLPYHVLIDQLREAGANAIGTTKRGIGPAYEDKVGRRGVRMIDLLDGARLRARVQHAVEAWAPTILNLGGEVPAIEPILEAYSAHGQALRPLIGDATERLHQAVERGESVVAEGAQGSLLDIDHGTYPYVTSSTVLASGAASGLGIGPTAISKVIGITKAYATRVGSGPFPTELHDALGERIRQRGGEFGSVTGRPRRCGWIDLVALRHATRLNGMTELVMTKADVLEGLETIRVCVAYEAGGQRVQRLPAALDGLSAVYEDLPGFSGNLSGCRGLADLPEGLRRLVALTEAATGVPITWLSVGPEREQSIRLR
ncbi:MAG: adenylosuccinate synthase [Sandaracinaceae bacterium]|nr:adenylosuccinate synthase [Sandaracinaceae bacterium]